MRRSAQSCLPVGLILLVLNLQPFAQFWTAWLAFVPFFLYLRSDPRFLRNTLLGYVLGLFYNAAALYWILLYELRIFLIVVALAALPWALFFGTVGWAYHRLRPFENGSSKILAVLIPPFAWALLSLIFRLTPLGNLPLEVPFYQPLPLLQLASRGGMMPLEFLILSFNASLALLVEKRDRTTLRLAGCLVLITLTASVWGAIRLSKPNPGSVRIALIQTNFPVSQTWRKENKELILEKYAGWAKEAAESKPALIFFPQYALPFDAYRQPEFFEKLSDQTDASIVLGTYIPKQEGVPSEVGGQYDVALAFSPRSGLTGIYQATQGPPFRRIRQAFGSEFPVIPTPAGRMGILLCYEDVSANVAKKWLVRGVDFFATLANTGHFAGTPLPRYHLLQDQLRAIENGREVVRVTPNGYSAVIDARGRIRALSKLNQEEILISTLENRAG